MIKTLLIQKHVLRQQQNLKLHTKYLLTLNRSIIHLEYVTSIKERSSRLVKLVLGLFTMATLASMYINPSLTPLRNNPPRAVTIAAYNVRFLDGIMVDKT